MSQNKAFSTPFILAVLCIYFSYFLHGISVITLAQNHVISGGKVFH